MWTLYEEVLEILFWFLDAQLEISESYADHAFKESVWLLYGIWFSLVSLLIAINEENPLEWENTVALYLLIHTGCAVVYRDLITHKTRHED